MQLLSHIQVNQLSLDKRRASWAIALFSSTSCLGQQEKVQSALFWNAVIFSVSWHWVCGNLVFGNRTPTLTGPAQAYAGRMFGFAQERILVAGDSGNDVSMFTGHSCGVLVGNAKPELVSAPPKYI